jgi:VWFA-related protein
MRVVKVTVCVTLLLCVLVCLHDSATTSAQNRSRQSKPKTTPNPSPTPTPTALELLGPPPPAPTLKQREPEVGEGETISVQTTEVMLPVTVRDATGRLVKDLSKNDFHVFENDREQPLSDFALRQVPVDVLLMIDSSSSAVRNLDDFRKAAEAFASRLRDDDRISLIKFDDNIQVLQDWTKSRFQLRRALNRIEPGMFTRFNDALYLAANEQYGKSQSRRAAIILTDGVDSGRGTTLDRAVSALLQAQVTVYVVSNTEISRVAKQTELESYNNATESVRRFNQLHIDDLRAGLRALDVGEQVLEQVVTATGGRLYKPASFGQLESAYAEVAEELRSQYAVFYTPLDKARDGKFRRTRVETTNKSYQTHSRIGYYTRGK